MGYKFSKSLDTARTRKLVGAEDTVFGIYPQTREDWLNLSIYQFDLVGGGRINVKVITGPASQLNGKDRGRIYQVGVLI